ncbi:MAG: DUF3025 domain-containing protein [Myxococcota bacterium]
MKQRAAKPAPEARIAGPLSTTFGTVAERHLARTLGLSLERWNALNARWLFDPREHALLEPLFHGAPTTSAGAILRPTVQQDKSEQYEAAVLRRAELPFRFSSWHDWFNLLSWQVWPRAKAALNLRQVIHYLIQLEKRSPEQWKAAPGRTVERDLWMQTLAMLDEGGCIATTSFLRQHTELDARRVYLPRGPIMPEVLADGVSFFGHASLEFLQGRIDAERRGHPCTETAPGLRLFVLEVSDLKDEVAASRILTFEPSLYESVWRQLPALERMEIRLSPDMLQLFRFQMDDPFRKPVYSLLDPWEQTTSTACLDI